MTREGNSAGMQEIGRLAISHLDDIATWHIQSFEITKWTTTKNDVH